MFELAPCPSQPSRPIPYGPVSLWEMINFSLFQFVFGLKLLEQEAALANERETTLGPLALITEKDRDRFSQNLLFGITPPLDALFIAEGRRGRLAYIAQNGGTYSDLAHELHALKSDIGDAAEFERFFHYPRDKALLVLKAEGTWQPVLKAFPSAKDDAIAAVDCYALGHSRASIHHSMMILELGLPALAKRLKVKFKADKTTWAPLIKDIRTQIESERNKLSYPPKGSKPLSSAAAKRVAAFLDACEEAAQEFRYFTNVWRNHISHGRGDYDENDAKKVMDHVRTFMEVIATNLKLKEAR